MSLGSGGGGGARSLKRGAQGGRDPSGFGPGGERSLGSWPREGGGAISLGGEIPGKPG